MKDHEIRELVSELTRTAQMWGQTQQLRERIRDVIFPVFEREKSWHDAVLDECVVRESCYVPDDPKKTLLQLFQWETSAALDPAISEPAQELIERGREAATVEIADLRAELKDANEEIRALYRSQR